MGDVWRIDEREEEPRVLGWLACASAWSPTVKLGAVALLFGAGVAIDLLTPVDVSLSFLYVVPLGLATWTFGLAAGLALTVLASGCAFAVEHWGAYAYTSAGHAYWAMGTRAVLFGALVWALDLASRAHHALVVRAERDALTGLFNRRGFAARAQVEVERARRYGRPLSVAVLDLDDFKGINDARGHLEGDRLLGLVGEALGRGRQNDLAARIGGDEFVLLMPETGGDAARAALERIRIALAASLAARGGGVTFTAGIATFEAPFGSLADLLRAADELLYAGKRRPKSRTTSGETIEPAASAPPPAPPGP